MERKKRQEGQTFSEWIESLASDDEVSDEDRASFHEQTGITPTQLKIMNEFCVGAARDAVMGMLYKIEHSPLIPKGQKGSATFAAIMIVKDIFKRIEDKTDIELKKS